MEKNEKDPATPIETKEIGNAKLTPEQESQKINPDLDESGPNVADPKQLQAKTIAKTKKTNQDNPNERQGFENKKVMNSVEHRLMRTKSSKPDKTYRTHIERNNNQTGIPNKEN